MASGTPVSILDADSTATLYYTTDGSTPTTNSTAYTSPITVSSAETINAIAVDANGRLTSAEGTGAYTYSLTCGGQESGFATLNVQ